jgi:hypothetical protein
VGGAVSDPFHKIAEHIMAHSAIGGSTFLQLAKGYWFVQADTPTNPTHFALWYKPAAGGADGILYTNQESGSGARDRWEWIPMPGPLG